jgi:hypothetical protein
MSAYRNARALTHLRAAWRTLPVCVTPDDFMRGHGGWGLSESEHRTALALARLIEALTAPSTKES